MRPDAELGATGSHAFSLRFPLDEVGLWADRYAYSDDKTVEAIGRKAAQRGWYTRAELIAVARWKTRGRTVHWCEMNTAPAVRIATEQALASVEERERVNALVALRGVQLPTASVLLHFTKPTQYPIIDFRALWSLGIDSRRASYAFEFWWAYTLHCRALAAKAQVSMRRLDRALWQYSNENQRSTLNAGAGTHIRPPTRASDAPGEGSHVARSDFPIETYVRLVAAAVGQETIAYSDLPGMFRTWGPALYGIAKYELDHGRPPLTAIVVRKNGGGAGKGVATVLAQAGYAARTGESPADLWHRALGDVFAYWKF